MPPVADLDHFEIIAARIVRFLPFVITAAPPAPRARVGVSRLRRPMLLDVDDAQMGGASHPFRRLHQHLCPRCVSGFQSGK
jgi:hypothetical protein